MRVKKITVYVILALAIFAAAVFSHPAKASSQTCNTMISEYVRWAQHGNMVDSQMSGVAMKTVDPNARHNFGFGRWAFARLEARGNSLQGTYQEYFSDRTDGRQPFDKDATDWLGVTISPNNGITLKLLSWGGGTVKVNSFSCTADGFITFRWPGARQMVTIALVKTYR